MSLLTVDKSAVSILALRFTDNEKTIATLKLAASAASSSSLDQYSLPHFIDAENTKGVGIIMEESEVDSDSSVQLYLGPEIDMRRILLLEETDYELELIPSEGVEIEDAFSDLFENSDSMAIRRMLLSSPGSDVYSLNFRSFVGNSDFDITIDGRKITIPFEVRSKKLHYRTDYLRMMQDVADFSTSLLLQMKSPVYRQYDFNYDPSRSRYEEFMILDYVFSSLDLIGSYESVKNNKHCELENYSRPIPASLSGRVDSSDLARMISSDNLVLVDGGPIIGRYAPITVSEEMSRVTYDTPENRLVRDVLLTIQRMVDLLSDHKGGCSDYVVRRLGEMKGEIDRISEDGWLKEIGDLTRIPVDSAVLERRRGYSDMFAIHRILGMSTMFTHNDYDNLLKGHGSRIHQVYEYWCYTRLFRCLWRMSDNKPDVPLISVEDRWTVSMKRGGKGVEFLIPEPSLTVTLYYNKEFSRDDKQFESYSLRLRPDYSLVIEVEGDNGKFIVNFDAKYKVKRNSANKVISDDEMSTDCWEYDIYKMHTYRDALLHSYGSYVMYPGDSEEKYVKPLPSRGEILPSVGAVPLVPGSAEDGSLELLLRSIFTDIVSFSQGNSARIE